jgi:membrane-bound ClpP family serine protease
MLSPDWMYLILVAALWFSVMAVYVPGTGYIESLGGVALVGVLWLLAGYQSNLHWVGVLLIVMGTLFFLIAPMLSARLTPWALFGLGVQVVGAFLMFQNPGVSPVVIFFTAALSYAYYQFALVPLLERVRALKSTSEDDRLIGAEGLVASAIAPQGTVKLRGETWTALSEDDETVLNVGERVRVIRREGLQLVVARARKHKPTDEALADAP